MAEGKDENDEFLARLISLVQQNKILYDKTNKLYYNRRKKEKVWKDIAAQTNKTSTECKAKWTGLREKFIRELKKKHKQSDSGAMPENEWELFSEMEFLKDVTKPRPTHSIEMVEAIKYSTSPLDEHPFPFIEECSTPPPLKKKSFDDLCDQFGNIISKIEERFDAQRESDGDADELFIRTVLSMLQDLPSSAKDEIKSDIFSKIIAIRKRYRSVC